jgi:hypothetical protein
MMKRLFALTLLVTALSVFTTRPMLAQGSLFASNLGEADSATASALGANWLAAEFTTGTNTGGYALDSIGLLFSDASGDPGNGFVLMLYTNSSGQPGGSIGTLSGSSAPDTAGTYTYTASGITLSALTPYWVVARPTALTGPYLWDDLTSINYVSSDGWSMNTTRYDSSDAHGSDWTSNSGDALQFAVDATPVPEPQTIVLAGLGLLFLRGRLAKAD